MFSGVWGTKKVWAGLSLMSPVHCPQPRTHLAQYHISTIVQIQTFQRKWRISCDLKTVKRAAREGLLYKTRQTRNQGGGCAGRSSGLTIRTQNHSHQRRQVNWQQCQSPYPTDSPVQKCKVMREVWGQSRKSSQQVNTELQSWVQACLQHSSGKG